MLAFAKLGHRCPPLLAALASALQHPEMVFTPRGLVDLLWSAAALQQVPAGVWTGLLLPVQMALGQAQKCEQRAHKHAHQCLHVLSSIGRAVHLRAPQAAPLLSAAKSRCEGASTDCPHFG